MKSYHTYIDIYDWRIKVYEIESHTADAGLILSVLKRNEIEKEAIDEIMEEVRVGGRDGGVHLSRTFSRCSLVIIYPCDSPQVRLRTITHELRHVQDRIMQECHLDDGEPAAFLCGFIYMKLFNLIYKK
jgi:hypothetical protein